MEEKKGANIGIKILCFFIPLVGLILYLTYNEENKLYAKQCGKSALIGLIVAIVIPIIIHIFSVILYTVSSSSVSTVNITSTMLEMEKKSFNSKFSIYEGTISGSKVKQLINTINSSNTANRRRLSNKYIY